MLALRKGLVASGNLKHSLQNVTGFPAEVTYTLDSCDGINDLILGALEEPLEGHLDQGWFIRIGFSVDLDNLKKTYSESIEYVASLERLERERTGIKSLKVGYNRVFGYYIEVSNVNLAQVPSDYSRRQTLVNGERFITQDLKEYEATILNTYDRIKELESNLFRDICSQVTEYQESIKGTSNAVAQIDLFVSLAHVAALYNYVRPRLTNDDTIEIEKGRHPVVERLISYGSFVPNDTLLDNINTQVVLLTGPNMAGKSTYIKQVGLIVMLAQIGSFVPAESATIGIVDRIFTRFGLQDDLSTGQSTFMVEMVETANILRQATKKSLILLDEIGRGTSTYDGLAIAKATAEHIHDDNNLGCKTLFATHYHELTQLSDVLSRVRNFSMAATDNGGQLVFLHTVVSGASDRSYGVQVAHLAGIPSSVIKRAWDILQQLEHDSKQFTGFQGPLFFEPHPILDEILSIDLSVITPLDAINKLHQLQTDIRESV
jgi:DNA mismatch repair protein MutS